jgi:ABC-type branched-subunit amino acid transport system permease subunit
VRNLVRYLIQHRRDPNVIAYAAMAAGALIFPILAQFVTGGNGNFIISQAADAGVYVLLAIGLNVVVGFAGLLDLGYAAFFAIGAYTYALLASNQGLSTPLHHAFHLPFWVLLFVGMFIAAAFGATLGAPTLRLRGDYLAIVTLGFGEIVPRVFKNLSAWTSGVNGISALDSPGLPAWVVGPWADAADFAIQTNYRLTSANPTAYYVIMVLLLVGCVILVNNLYNSRLGRAWMAVREDEVAAAAMGVNTVTTKLLAFGIGAAFSGFAGAFYGAKLSLVSPENFGFTVSVTILVMVVLGGMGNIPGVMIGALLIYYVLFNILPNLPQQAKGIAEALGLNVLVTPTPGYPGLVEEVQRLKFLLFGIILVTVMVLRPQGLLPSRIRRAELKHEGTEPVLDVGTA